MVNVIFLVALLAAGNTLLADETGNALPEENLKKWRSFSPQERSELISRYRKWQSLPDSQRAKIRERLDSLKKLPPDELALMRKNCKKYRNLSPEQRASVAEKFQKWNHLKERLVLQLPESQRKNFSALPPEVRRARVMELFNQLRRRRCREFADWNLSHQEREKLRPLPENEFLRAAHAAMRAQTKEEIHRLLTILPPDEKERILKMPEPERERELRALIQQRFNRRKDQVWEKLTEQEKANLQSLLPGVFHLTVNRLWHERVEKELLTQAAPLAKRLEAILVQKDLKERQMFLRAIHQFVWNNRQAVTAPSDLTEDDLKELKTFPPEVIGQVLSDLRRRYCPTAEPRNSHNPHSPKPPVQKDR